MKKKTKIFKKILLTLFVVFNLAMCVGIGGVSHLLNTFIEEAPSMTLQDLTNIASISYVYDSNENEIARLSGQEKRIYVQYSEIPKQLIDAFIAIEDKRFWQHHGIDLVNYSKAVFEEVFKGGATRGGSTITQQLIKNLYLTSERSYKRKALEFIMAQKLEDQVSKEKILESYLNEIFMGEDNYGIKAASLDYFGKDLNELSLKESAILAAIPAAPNIYEPRGNYEDALWRGNLVLQNMLEQELITQHEYNTAYIEEPEISEKFFSNDIYKFPSFVDFTLDQVAKDMLTKEGKELSKQNIASKKYDIRIGGYKIYTTLDADKQTQLQQIAHDFKYVTDGVEMSAVIIDHHTGEIKVMIPGRNENEVMDGFNRATDSLQPIGSSAKPIFVYAPFIESGANTDTIVDDTKSKIRGYNTTQGYPNGDTTNSKITLRYAIETSRNVAAVKTLAYQVGIDKSFDFQKKMGINPNHSSQSLNGIALGSDGLTTLECAGAYATLANDGVYIRPHSYTYVTDFNDNIVLKSEDFNEQRRVFSSETSWMITDILKTTASRGFSVNARIPNITTVGKTGTHEDTAVTFGGYTAYYTGFVRISNDDYTPIKENSYTNSSTLWKQLMTPMHAGLPNKEPYAKDFNEVNIIKWGEEYRKNNGSYTQKVYILEPAPEENSEENWE